MSIQSVNIYVAEGKFFPCPVGWTVDRAETRIRTMYRLEGGGVLQNGVAMDSVDLITSDGDYRFVNYQEAVREVKSTTSAGKYNVVYHSETSTGMHRIWVRFIINLISMNMNMIHANQAYYKSDPCHLE
jgi:hypothetical protein